MAREKLERGELMGEQVSVNKEQFLSFIHSFNATIFSPRNISCALTVCQALEFQWRTRGKNNLLFFYLRLGGSSHPQNRIDAMSPFI